MFYILSFWMLFLLDTAIVLFSFTIFVCMWMSTLLIMYVLCVMKMNNTYITWEFMSSKYIDMYWFTLGSLFMLCLLLRLCLLLYFGCLNFMSFDLCKCIGFQWYWMYYMFNDNTMFSNLILESDYFMGDLRLLQCNHILTLLSLVMYKLWLSSMDVMHSFTLSSLGIKMEVPGSCNELMLFCCTNATLYGQCSELCGVLHGFMPMVVYFM